MENAKYWVKMHDTFMSGWGKAGGKKNWYVVECENLAQANTIAANAKRRGEMKRVSILPRKPQENGVDLYTWKHYDDLSGPWKE